MQVSTSNPPISPVAGTTRFKHLGRDAAPKVVLSDEYGVPLPNADQRRTDVHGRALQPESDPEMPYLPVAAPAEEVQAKAKAELALAQVRRLPFTQREVDLVRYRVTINLARTGLQCGWPAKQPKRHVWFPEAGNIGVYELREGNAPPPQDRPKHLRRVNLAIDIDHIPDMWFRALRKGGTLDALIAEAIAERGLTGVVAHAALLQETISRLAKTHPWPGISP